MKRISKLLACLWVGAGALVLSSSALAETGAWTPESSPPDVLENGVVASLPNRKVILAGGIRSAGRNTLPPRRNRAQTWACWGERTME